jgi:hypothetical protein
VIENKIFEGTYHLKAVLNSGTTSLQVMVASARGLGWGSNEAVTFLLPITYPNALMYSMQTQYTATFPISTTEQNPHSCNR